MDIIYKIETQNSKIIEGKTSLLAYNIQTNIINKNTITLTLNHYDLIVLGSQYFKDCITYASNYKLFLANKKPKSKNLILYFSYEIT